MQSFFGVPKVQTRLKSPKSIKVIKVTKMMEFLITWNGRPHITEELNRSFPSLINHLVRNVDFGFETMLDFLVHSVLDGEKYQFDLSCDFCQSNF